MKKYRLAVIGTTNCKPCIKLKQTLKDNDILYTPINLDNSNPLIPDGLTKRECKIIVKRGFPVLMGKTDTKGWTILAVGDIGIEEIKIEIESLLLF